MDDLLGQPFSPFPVPAANGHGRPVNGVAYSTLVKGHDRPAAFDHVNIAAHMNLPYWFYELWPSVYAKGP
jgi:hypothetical protein